MLKILLFILGWVLFVLAQARNSISSGANGLTGWAGFVRWLRLQAVNLATRAFFCGIFYGFLVQTVAAKIEAAGISSITSTTIAGLAGYAANALLYQMFGLLPWLRVEIPDLAPPGSQGQQQLPPKAGS
jgi:hypothetical protein